MDTVTFTVTGKCLSCGAPLNVPQGEEYSSGDLIECLECGEKNDYDMVREATREQARPQAEEIARAHLRELLRKKF